MGRFFVTIEIGDEDGQRFEAIHALVDTGATYTSVATSVLNRLGVQPREKLTSIQADGSTYDRDVGQTWARVDGKSVITMVIFAEEEAPRLLGAYTLEGVRLAPDPVNKRLVPVPGYLVSNWPV